jgi:uncharacterized membrane protein (UPF0127 family)
MRTLALLAAALFLAVGCRGAPSGGRPDAPASQARPRVTVEGPGGRSSAVDVEVARTADEQERGLMFRNALAPDAGMLFVFPDEREHVFWMKNTLIPLDMIFIADGGRVVGVVENAEPLTTSQRTVHTPSRYVLEVNGGWSAAHGVKAGDVVRMEGVPAVK